MAHPIPACAAPRSTRRCSVLPSHGLRAVHRPALCGTAYDLLDAIPGFMCHRDGFGSAMRFRHCARLSPGANCCDGRQSPNWSQMPARGAGSGLKSGVCSESDEPPPPPLYPVRALSRMPPAVELTEVS